MPKRVADDRATNHLRATPEQVREKWRKGFYTPKGYLHDLIEAFRKQGWWFRIESVSVFCKEWEIKRRTFYRAKAELIAEGGLEENIIGIIELRIPVPNGAQPVPNGAQPVPNGAQPVPNGAQPVPNGAQPVPNGAQTIAKSIDVPEFYEFPRSITDLSQLNSSLFLNAQAEQKNTNTPDEQEEPEPPDSTIGQSNSLASSKPDEPAPTEQGEYSAASDFSSEKEIHPVERCDRRFKREPWGFYSNPDPGFLDFLIRSHLRYVDPYKNYPKITRNHAKKWLKKALHTEERYSDALIQWDEYQDAQAEVAKREEVRRTAETIPASSPLTSSPIADTRTDTREDLIARLRGKAAIERFKSTAIAEARAAGISLEELGITEGAA